VPYMSIELMEPLQPLEHRLEHDLESVLMVILHIARFTCGPTGDAINEVKSSFNISLWHHEPVVGLVKRNKEADIFDIHENPTNFITEYWNPIGHYLIKLIDLIYPGIRQRVMAAGPATCKSFKEVLVAARDHCEGLQEQTANYAAFTSNRKRKSKAQDRGKTKQLRRPKKDTVDPIRRRPAPARVSSRSQYWASGPAG
jgi:hypothetical protein